MLSCGTLAARVETAEDELGDVVAWLVNARLLRRDEVAGEIMYEMAHEYLIEEVKKWVDPADLAFKQMEELLTREVANWRVHGTLIPRDRLELLYAQRERFRGLDGEEWECILRSALQADFAVEDWAKLAGELGEGFFLAALDDPLEEVRRAAIRSLGALWGIPEVSRLGNENDDVRWDTVTAVGKLGDPRAVGPLIAALQDSNDEYGDWHWVVAEALAELCDSRAVETLIAALQNEDGCIRLEAANLLGAVGDSRAVEPLIAALQDEYSDVRGAVAEALGMLGNPRALEPLIAALWDMDSDVRRAAAEALGEIGYSRAVRPLMAALQDMDSNVRWAAAEALGKIGDHRAVESLIAALEDQDRNELGLHLQEVAAEALMKIGTPEALAALE